MATPSVTKKTQDIGAYLLRVTTDKIINFKLPNKYNQFENKKCCEWEWDIWFDTPRYLEVWNTTDRSDVPFKYYPNEEETYKIRRIFKMVKGEPKEDKPIATPPVKQVPIIAPIDEDEVRRIREEVKVLPKETQMKMIMEGIDKFKNMFSGDVSFEDMVEKNPHLKDLFEKKIKRTNFIDHFNIFSIEAGEKEFKERLEAWEKEGCPHFKLERYSQIFNDCKMWATGAKPIGENINFTFDNTETNEEDFNEIVEDYYLKVMVFLYFISIYNQGNHETPEGNKDYDEWRKELDESGFKLIRQRSMGKNERIGYIGIFTKQEWDDLINKSPNAKHMTKYDTQIKTGFMCNCGCLTFQKNMLKSTCCGARYVDAEHIKKHWKEHKKVCEKFQPAFYLPINREEELAMPLCAMSCMGCDFCEYKPRFICV